MQRHARRPRGAPPRSDTPRARHDGPPCCPRGAGSGAARDVNAHRMLPHCARPSAAQAVRRLPARQRVHGGRLPAAFLPGARPGVRAAALVGSCADTLFLSPPRCRAQKCSRFHPLSSFDGPKRTCARMLDVQNCRRRERTMMSAVGAPVATERWQPAPAPLGGPLPRAQRVARRGGGCAAGGGACIAGRGEAKRDASLRNGQRARSAHHTTP